MARIRRKFDQFHQRSTKKFRTAMYLRLSVEGGGSIENQQLFLQQYLENHPELHLLDVFQDVGVSGTHFNRPSFRAMMERVEKKEFDVILVKDYSRFGRHYLEMGRYLQEILPRYDVTLLAVNDLFQTMKGDYYQTLLLHLIQISNEGYARESSAKISAVLRQKQERGEFLGRIPPYGYRRNPSHPQHLMIDTATAPVVVDIYRMKLQGYRTKEIQQTLYNQKIPPPSQKDNPLLEVVLWRGEMIRQILRNPVYLGHKVAHKRSQSFYKGIQRHTTSSKEWIVVEDCHPPIISAELFQQVQNLMPQKKGKVSL